ncbi:39S ribosomal protein L28 [Schistosoma japonicum]|uniref:Large ribosomal subunit protein bL28m n=1 Tax=Schistosoma japonicum TaxID=6182 RepID=Q5D9B2_SCHJA|nr:SJCHGC01033 protein [Schistosoma japonicum]KAH8877122.1 39S ribosomal protein L28, mitochondrial [Schistosoma japonicum]TNN16465.1 39S ribosomal protein L28 [Schistosoma japonicum]CAX73858.1 39S ribosomal protein L28, mitochondrial precursor [Schistosoma japonicum]CAX73859.1 39S ribosomal protein L28, mitochondrial precursor [Schistosoma japonicum]
MSRLFFYNQIKDVINRLPAHYRKRYLQNQSDLANERLCSSSLVKDGQTGNVLPSSYFDTPLNIIYPPESQKCLWGGEGIIQGYWEKKNQRPKFPKAWRPVLMENLFYSEILDRWMVIIVSDSALKQIENAGGFDFYILSTPQSKLKSRLGMHLKRDMLVTLAKSKKDGMMKSNWQKYSGFIIPLEEAEWIGLTLEEAVKKQMKIEYEISRSRIRPLKFSLAEKLIDSLRNPGEHEEDSEEEKKPSYLLRIFNLKASNKHG